MTLFIVRRLASTIIVLLIVSLAVFALTELLPGDAAVELAGGSSASRERIEEVRQQLNLDKPFPVRYLVWVGDAVRLDFGKSLFVVGGGSVMDEIASRLPLTLALAVSAAFVAIVIALPLGVAGAVWRGGVIDRVSRGVSSSGIAIPNFVLGIALIVIFAVRLRWFPVGGYVPPTENLVEWAKHLTLPALTLGVSMAAILIRQLRASLLEVLDTNYIRSAWARGATPRIVIMRHALRNAAIPAVTLLGLQFARLLGGTVIIEQIFTIPGVGSYMLAGIIRVDLPVVQGVTMVFVLSFILVNLVVDISYGFLNPKVRIAQDVG